MELRPHLVLPFISAVVYVAAAMLLKRSSDLGGDVWRTTRIINYTSAVVSMPLWLLGGTVPPASLWWQPVVAAVLFFGGQVLSLLALSTGDVSVATPVLGVKILLVALLTAVLIGDSIGARLWTSTALSTAAIALLNLGGTHARGRVGRTILLAALGATAYACFDVLVQKWSPIWGTGRFLPIAMTCAAVYSLLLYRVEAPRPVVTEHRAAAYTPWLFAGALCFAVQGLVFISSISLYRQATTANVIYSSRGLLGVIAVWSVGHWFTNREQHLGRRVLAWRFAGAMLLMTALIIVLLDEP